MQLKLSSVWYNFVDSRPTQLALQISVITAIAFFFALVALILNLNNLYKRDEQALAREKLYLLWTEVLSEDQPNAITNMNNLYFRDVRISKKLYGIRLADKRLQTLLLQYPESWRKYTISQGDFDAVDVESSPYRLKIMERNRAYQTNIDVYTLSVSDYHVQVLVSVEERINFLISVFKRGIPIILGIIVVSFAIASFAVRKVLSPVNNINRVVEKIIEDQSIKRRLKETHGSEFSRLQVNFNTMLDVIERQVHRARESAINIGHDIRTPLTRLQNEIESLLLTTNNPEEIKKLEICLESIEGIRLFSKQVLELSEIESGSVTIPKEPILVKDELAVLIEMFEYLSTENHISFEYDIAEDAYMHIDVVRLRQVVSNLLDNAIKFTKAGGRIVFSVRKNMQEIHFSVADTGIGISEEDIRNIWVATWKGDNQGLQNEHKTGRGFGLSIVESIVKAYRGRIFVDSVLGKGTQFDIYFKRHIT